MTSSKKASLESADNLAFCAFLLRFANIIQDFLIIDLTIHSKAFGHCLEAFLCALPATHIWLNTGGEGRLDKNNFLKIDNHSRIVVFSF